MCNTRLKEIKKNKGMNAIKIKEIKNKG